MLRKLALKKLKDTDLSFFKSYFSKHSQSKQKGFNLDAKVMEGSFFPALKALLKPLPKGATHVDLVLFGPGMASAHSLARKVKIDAKNIRLNGELVHDPDDEPNRYAALKTGDFAVIEFGGGSLPEVVKVVLIAANNSEDVNLHAFFRGKLPREDDSMIVLEEEVLQAAISDAVPHSLHPIRDWLDPVQLEEVGAGDARAIAAINMRRPGRGISPEDFKATKEGAARTGQLGEELMKHFLDSSASHGVASHDWVSQTNAISPYDFLLVMTSGEKRHADAKSTSGPFASPLYLSTAEIRHALSSGVPYDIYRFYNVKASSGELRVARDVKGKLETVITSLSGVPAGVRVDSLSFDPSFFTFDEVVHPISLAPED